MLDEGLPEDMKERKKMHQYKENSKVVIEGSSKSFPKFHSFFLWAINTSIFIETEKGKNHFEVLPEGWLSVTHNSGLPIYMHKVSRVCSLSRPYFLGPGSLRVNNQYIWLEPFGLLIILY